MSIENPLTRTQIELLRALAEQSRSLTPAGNVRVPGHIYPLETLRALRQHRMAKHGADSGVRVAASAYITQAGRKFIAELDRAE